jgi:hypothetical protein
VNRQAGERKPLRCDRWTASSVLQKAIRRGNTEIARRAAVKLLIEIRSNILRRLLVIGFEDVGAAGPGVLIEIGRTVGSSEWRHAGTRDQLLMRLVSELAESPKDRSTDYLVSAAQHHPTCSEFGKRCSLMSPEARREVLADFSAPLEFRSVTALSISGLGLQSIQNRGAGDLEAIAEIYRDLGVAADFVATAMFAAKKTREAITILAPLVWLEVERGGGVPTDIVDGVPLYGFDKHTRLGKRAIRELIGADTPLKCCLEEFVPKPRWQATAEMAAYYADAAPIARRLEWPLSHAVEVLGREADFFKVGVPSAAIKPLQAAMAAALGKLNEIRKALWVEARASVGAGEGA